MSNQLLKTNVI